MKTSPGNVTFVHPYERDTARQNVHSTAYSQRTAGRGLNSSRYLPQPARQDLDGTDLGESFGARNKLTVRESRICGNIRCLSLPKKKPGPDPERLIIDEDPAEALRRLLKVPPTPSEPEEEDEPEP